MAKIAIALKQLAHDKCLGPDGFNINFFAAFWPQLKHTYHSMIMKAVETNILPASMREGTISLMEKINKNPLKISHWRLLSMLCTKVIANQLSCVLPDLISMD